VTAIVTGEKGDGTLTREGLEEYVSDCVILLDHRVSNQISTRRLRIIKYRGSLHGTNEYPFLIDEEGISVLPVTSLKLEAKVSSERVSTGIAGLDAMLAGYGFYKGSSILVSGTAGTGKTSLAACFANQVCNDGGRCIYFAFEESPEQIIRNMHSINMNLEKHVAKGLLRFHASRPTLYGLEMHLVTMHELIKQHKPDIVILDPITDFFAVGSHAEVKAAITRIIDFLKANQITALFTSYTEDDTPNESVVGVSSLIDTWISLRNLENRGERQRGLFILKSRGMPHSNQIRSFNLTDGGIKIGALDLAGRRAELNSA